VEAAGSEEGMGTLICCKDGDAGVVLHWFSMDVVAVVVLEDE
jgi:hypothetical protein